MIIKDKANTVLFIFIIILFSYTYCEYLIFPLKALKKSNLNIDYNNKDIQKYLSKNITLNTFLTNYFYKPFYSEINVGNPKQEMKIEFSTSYSSLINAINSKYQKKENINYYNKSLSITNISYMKDSYDYWILLSGQAEDVLYFNITSDINNINNCSETKVRLLFEINAFFFDILSYHKEDYDIKSANQTFNFIAGFLLDNSKYNFLNNLKTMNVLPSYDFSFDFYKTYNVNNNSEEDEIGNLIFGKFELLYNSNKYPKQYLKSTKLLPSNSSKINYIIYFDRLHVKGEKDLDISVNVKCEFKFDYGFIVSNNEFKEYIYELFFSKVFKICSERSVETNFYDPSNPIKNYKLYVCDSDIKDYKNLFPKIFFKSKDLDYDFEFNYDDLFKQYFDKVYFLILFQKYDQKWRFGDIFLKKYKLYFNIDSKQVYFYNKNIINDYSSIYMIIKIVVAIILISLIFISGLYIGKQLRGERKIRANELEDNYEYLNNINDKK